MSKQWHGGKGDKPRSPDQQKYSDGWERVFGKPEPKVKARKHQPSHSVTQIHIDKKKKNDRKEVRNIINKTIEE